MARGWATVTLRGALLAAGLATSLAVGPAEAQSDAAPAAFADWLEGLRAEARGAGISDGTLETALAEVAPIERVLELDRRQPEFTQTFWTYMDKRVTPERIERGRRLLAEHRELLGRVAARYGVQPRFLVAFWGLETNYGDLTGGFPVIGALATLAYDERRADFFRIQLLDALKILDDGDITLENMTGSWAGAMGQVQFIPSTYLGHAVDFDGDRRRDIWFSLPDIFASAANFLSNLGWASDEIWGREVRLPPDFDLEQADLSLRKPIADWQRLGVRRADGSDLPMADIEGAIVLPAGHHGPAFLVYRNFDAILDWNRSILYALSVGHLADQLIGLGGLRANRPADDRPLSRAEVEEIQALLTSLGYDAGEADGVLGSRTREALRAFQRAASLPPDGYPTPEVLDRLRRTAGARSGAG